MRFLTKLMLWILLGTISTMGVLAAELTSRRYHEPPPLAEFKAALDTIHSWDDQISVVLDFAKRYPGEIEVQMLVLSFRLADNPHQVRAECEKRASENPKDIAALFLAGRAAKDAEVQLDFAQRILAIDSDNYWGLFLFAWHYAGLKPPDFNKVEESYLKAITADNSLPYAFQGLGRLYQMKGDKEKADEVFVLLSRMMPDDFDPVRMRITLRGADYKESLKLTRKFLKEYPENPAALEMEARLQRELKDWPGYIDASRRVLAVEPKGGNAYNLACAFSLGGEVDSAFAALELASQLGYNDLDQYKEDEDLIPLHDDPRWGNILVMVETAYARELTRLRQEAFATARQRHEKALRSRLEEPAPDWSLEDFSGNKVRLADLRGNIVIIDFWAIWCGPCRKTMPLVDKFYQSNKHDNVKVFGINVWERKKGPDEIKAYIKSKGYQFPILFGDEKIASDYGVRGIPTLFVIDPEGNIAYRHVGYNLNMDEVLTWQVEEILKSVKAQK